MRIPARWNNENHVSVHLLALDPKHKLATIELPDGMICTVPQTQVWIVKDDHDHAQHHNSMICKLRELAKHAHGDWRGLSLNIHVTGDDVIMMRAFVELQGGGHSVTVDRHDDDIGALLHEVAEKARTQSRRD